MCAAITAQELHVGFSAAFVPSAIINIFFARKVILRVLSSFSILLLFCNTARVARFGYVF